jgi:hypothetical protein
MSLVRDLSVSAVAAGFVTVLVGFASSAVIVFQAASAVGATEAQVGGIRSANQGSIQLFGLDGGDESAPFRPTSMPVKRIRVVSIFESALK